MDAAEPLRFRVSGREDGWLLKTVLRSKLRLSRKLLSKLKRSETGILLNGSRAWVNVPVKAGDLIEVHLPVEQSTDILPQPIPFRIIFEDAHLLIVDKPAGIVVHPTHGHYINTLANGVVHYWREKGEICRFRPIHRLDQETSGVLAIAKSQYAHQQISLQMQAGTMEKAYLAIAHSVPPAKQGTVDAAIGRDPANPRMRIIMPNGYRAITHYAVQEVYGCPPAASLIRLRLETGRTHQIRVHLRHLGCPLVGDKLYGAASLPNEEQRRLPDGLIGRQALHAASLAFHHPLTGDRMRFSANLPEDMERLIAQLRTD
ncbi:MAG TPA: RluA family pseudouridine synthase [Bacilli bacterium]